MNTMALSCDDVTVIVTSGAYAAWLMPDDSIKVAWPADYESDEDWLTLLDRLPQLARMTADTHGFDVGDVHYVIMDFRVTAGTIRSVI